MRIQTARDIYRRTPVLKVAVTGHSGAGKTDWACRAPRPLILLTEVQALPSIMAANPDALVVPLERWDDFRHAFEAVKQGRPSTILIDGEEQPSLDVTIEGQTVQIQTLVLDTMTDLQRLAFSRMLGAEAGGGMDRLDFEEASNNLSIDKHGVLISAAETIWQQQRAIPVSTIWLTLARDVQDDMGVKQTLPMLTGKSLPYALGQYFNAVGLAQTRRSEAGGVQHLIRWQAPTSAALVKAGPGWPAMTLNTRTPGQTTLGSLLRFTFPDLAVAHETDDDAAFVRATLATPASSTAAEAVSSPAPSTSSQTASIPARPRRRA